MKENMDWNNLKQKIRKLLCCFLCVGIWGFLGSPAVMGARVTGEEGVTTTSSETEPKTQRPLKAKPREKSATQKRPVRTREKVINKEIVKKKVITEDKKTTKRSTPGKPYVTIDFDNVDIAIFIKFISELTGKNFVIDKAVKGRVTIISPNKISVKEAYRVFESVLEVHGYTTVPAGSITKIVPAVQARSKDIETRLRAEGISAEDKVVTQLIPLKYAGPNELKKLFAPLISKSSVIVSYPPTGMLIITDVLSNIKRLLRIVDAVDVEGIGEEISIVPLEHAMATVMAKSLGTLFQKKRVRVKKGAPLVSDIKIVPDERTNVLIVLASEYDTMKIKQLVKLLDRATPPGEGDVHVYYLENANAEELVKVLMAIPSKQEKGVKKGKAPVVSKEVQIVADKATNSLVIMANKEDYLVLEDVIKKLDIVRKMVYIEALFMEVDARKAFDLGMQWFIGDEKIATRDGKNIAAFAGSTPSRNLFPSIDPVTSTGILPPGLLLGVLGEAITIAGIDFPNIGAVVKAFQGDSDVHIISTPQLMTLDNEEAEIQIAKNIPYLVRQETSVANIDYSNYEYKDVGVTLNIVPQINQERFVRLKISQEIAQVVTAESTVGLPTTLKRVAKTTVTVKDGHTVVIGGLIDQALNESTSSVPCLGDIPGLGWLFRATSRAEDKTNLFIFVTPHIIENPDEAKEVYEEKRDYIEKLQGGGIKMYDRPGSKSSKEKKQ
ncbi:MAG: type II secretion system protein GspD [Desulfobacteraceae bacterium]|nr:MAG: type II secretion system protein GspD [Desulfobacteraceae bacterium]